METPSTCSNISLRGRSSHSVASKSDRLKSWRMKILRVSREDKCNDKMMFEYLESITKKERYSSYHIPSRAK